VGVHPEEKLEKLTELAGLLSAPQVVGVGEIGLDYHYDGTDKKAQQEALEYQLNLAVEHNLPVSFHVREAFADFWPIFDAVHQQKPVRGVLHCFTGTRQDLADGLKRGLYISLNGIVTFNKDPELNEVFKTVPLDRVLLETDAPYLAPVPYRGQVNQPAYVREVAQAFAELRGVSVAEIEKITTQNVKDLFFH
jgi:TatD DNase family protein